MKKDLIDSFKKLNEDEKKSAIKEFLINNIDAISNINKNIGNEKELLASNIDNEDDLVNIYELLLIMTDEISSFAEYVENRFFE